MEKKNSKKMKVLVILGIIILPVVYSLFYLKGFWDPYNSLDSVPVALVNNDECKEDCKGTELVKKLKENGTFDFKVVTEEKADKGLINKDYYAVIKIPKDFTESFESASTKDRKEATITYTPNTKTSYLASQIIGSAVKQVEATLSKEVSKEVTKTLTDNLKDVPNQTKQISDALGTISDGTSQLEEGATKLKEGTNTLNTSYKAFDNGINELTSGITTLNTNYKTLDNGINTLYTKVHNELIPTVNQSMTDLTTGVNNLKTGSNTITTTLNQTDYQNQMNSFMDNTTQIYTALSQMCDASMLTNEELCTAAKGYLAINPATNKSNIATLKDGTNGLVNGQTQVNDGINTLATSLNTSDLTNAIKALDENLLKIKNGSAEVSTGINKIKEGASTLNTNSSKINSGINTLDTSVSTLKSGTNELNNGVNTAKTAVDNKIDETQKQVNELDGLDKYAQNPVKINEKDYGKVKDYGTFFSPYFMSLSLWVGGILILMGLYYDPDKRFKVLGRNSENRVKRLIYYNIIGIIQAILLAFILQVTLDFTVTNHLVYYGSCILISEAFLAIIMFLFFNFQDIGKFLSLVLLVLQLASCGGTFPIQTEPSIYQAIYPYMPMTYSVDLLRESFVIINSEFLTKDILIMIILIIVFNLLIFITSYLKSKKEQSVKEPVKQESPKGIKTTKAETKTKKVTKTKNNKTKK